MRLNSQIGSHFFPLAAALLSGILMAASLIPWDLSILAWVAWIPLLAQLLPISSSKSCAVPFRLGYIAGLAFWFATIPWLRHVTVPGMLALAAFLALYMGAWSWFLAQLRRRWPEARGGSHLIVAFLGACGWVGLEWVRGWALGGFPWNFAAVSQHQNLALIQICEWTGVYGVSFVIVFFNLCFWLTIRRMIVERFSAKSWRYEFSVAIFGVAFCLFIGMRILFKQPQGFREGDRISTVKLALVQPNIPQDVKYEPLSREGQQQRLRELSLTAAAIRPDLVVWPETALVEGPSFDLESRQWLRELVGEIKTPIFFGTLDFSRAEPGSSKGAGRVHYYNAAEMIDLQGELSPPYRKLHLVPFGEYVPFEEWMPWMRWLTPISTSFAKGERVVVFHFRDLRLGALICFEDTFPHLAAGMSRGGADVLMNLTNDAWFKNTHAAAMHAANAVFRAIETRRPLVRCTNNGLTLVVSSTGKVTSQMKPFNDGFQLTTLTCRVDAPLTFFTRYGDWFPMICLALAGIGGGIARTPSPKAPSSATCGNTFWVKRTHSKWN